MRQAVRPRVQLAIGQLRPFENQRHPLRRARRLILEQLMQKTVLRIVDRRVVPFHQQTMSLRRLEQVQFTQPAIGIGDDPFQQDAKMPTHPLDRGRVEQRRRVIERRPQPLLGLDDRQREIELRAGAVAPERFEPQAAERGAALGRILQDEHHLEQRIAAHVARRLQLLDQPFEGQVLMRLRPERRLPHARQQPAEARIARNIRAHHQRVDEEADQRLELETAPVGDRRAHADVLLPAVARQQELKRREKRHEQRRAFRAAEARETLGHVPAHHEAMRRPGMVLPRRTRTIRRQIERRRRIRQFLPPIGELPVEDLALQPVSLPDRIIGILDRKIGQWRRPSGGEGFIEGHELADQHVRRPAVRDDVVQREQHDALALAGRRTNAEIERRYPQQRSRGEIEGPARFLLGETPGFGLPQLGIEPAEIDDGRRDLQRGRDHLRGNAVAQHEGRAQRFVPPHDLVDREGEGRDVELADHAQRRGYVVGGVSGLQLVQEPQALLRKGKRKRLRPRGRADIRKRRFSGVGVRLDLRGERRDPGRGEEAAQGQLPLELPPYPGDELHRQQRMPAELEEIVLDADAIEAEHLGEDAAQRRLGSVARRHIAPRDLRVEVGSRKRLAVDLAVGRQRQRVERDEGSGDHIIGQLARQRRAQLRRLHRCAVIGDRIGDEPLLAPPILPSERPPPRGLAAGGRAPPRSRRARCGSRGS